MTTTIIPVIDLPFLAREISDAHRQVVFHGKSMVAEAIRAGEALERAKVELKAARKLDPTLPAFKEWVEPATGVSYRTAAAYMRAAEKGAGACTFLEEGITLHEFLYGEAQADQRARKKAEAAAAFSREDAEYALKILAMAERGATEGERSVAATKLSRLAAQFGMSAEAMVVKAKVLVPAPEQTAEERAEEERFAKAKAEWEARQAAREAEFEKENAAREERYKERDRRMDELTAQVERLVKRREELFKDHRNRPKEELLDLLVAAELRLEGFGT